MENICTESSGPKMSLKFKNPNYYLKISTVFSEISFINYIIFSIE